MHKKYRYFDKKDNKLTTKFGDMVDLADVKNKINLSDINHVQTSQILFDNLIETKKKLNLSDKNHVGLCTDGASNVSSLLQGVAGKVWLILFAFFLDESVCFCVFCLSVSFSF